MRVRRYRNERRTTADMGMPDPTLKPGARYYRRTAHAQKSDRQRDFVERGANARPVYEGVAARK